jgi:hypothetical protein
VSIPYVIIRNNTIIVNDKTVFSQKKIHITAFLEKAYLALKIDYPKFYKMDTLSKLGFLAAELLLGSSRISDHAAESVAVVLSNASASLDTDMRYAAAAKTAPSPGLFVYTLANIVAGEIGIRHKIKGENAFFISPAFDAELMTAYVHALFEHETRACLAGWVDVMGDHHDVFLYLMEKNNSNSPKDTAQHVKALYHNTLWNN